MILSSTKNRRNKFSKQFIYSLLFFQCSISWPDYTMQHMWEGSDWAGLVRILHMVKRQGRRRGDSEEGGPRLLGGDCLGGGSSFPQEPWEPNAQPFSGASGGLTFLAARGLTGTDRRARLLPKGPPNPPGLESDLRPTKGSLDFPSRGGRQGVFLNPQRKARAWLGSQPAAVPGKAVTATPAGQRGVQGAAPLLGLDLGRRAPRAALGDRQSRIRPGVGAGGSCRRSAAAGAARRRPQPQSVPDRCSPAPAPRTRPHCSRCRLPSGSGCSPARPPRQARHPRRPSPRALSLCPSAPAPPWSASTSSAGSGTRLSPVGRHKTAPRGASSGGRSSTQAGQHLPPHTHTHGSRKRTKMDLLPIFKEQEKIYSNWFRGDKTPFFKF